MASYTTWSGMVIESCRWMLVPGEFPVKKYAAISGYGGTFAKQQRPWRESNPQPTA